ncbi:hypothetical protein [Pseudomonas peli]|uniref:hypothetical protein n=1 Tax=Pseudomonas peli TaxID=592361 RepID=UPI0024AE5C1D|nr:hypothetical protein [Pseudomonas peli]
MTANTRNSQRSHRRSAARNHHGLQHALVLEDHEIAWQQQVRLIEAPGFQQTAQGGQGLLGSQVQPVGVLAVEAAQPLA